MPTRIDVCRMLGSLDSDPVGRFAEAIVLSSVDTKLRSPLQKAFTMVQDYLHDKDAPVLTVDQAKVFERLAPPSFGLRPIDQPAFTETLLVAVYSRATELLRGPGRTRRSMIWMASLRESKLGSSRWSPACSANSSLRQRSASRVPRK